MSISHLTLRLLSIITITLLSGCGGKNSAENDTIMTPMGEQEIAVRYDDGYLKSAMQDYLQYRKAPLFSQYDFTKKDLNDDGIMDSLVYMKTPYGRWCNSSGCTLLIFKGHPEGFSVVGDIASVRPPFDISSEETHGWKNIKVHISGKTEKAHTRMLFFNGKQYTQSPVIEPYMNRNYVNEIGISP